MLHLRNNEYSMNKLIKDLIKEKGFTQQTLADKIGYKSSSLNQVLNGNPSVSSLQKIADALEVPMWRLFATEDEVKREIKPDPAQGAFRCPKCGAKMRIQIEISE